MFAACLVYSSTLKMEVVHSSEMSVHFSQGYTAAQRHSYRCENLITLIGSKYLPREVRGIYSREINERKEKEKWRTRDSERGNSKGRHRLISFQAPPYTHPCSMIMTEAGDFGIMEKSDCTGLSLIAPACRATQMLLSLHQLFTASNASLCTSKIRIEFRQVQHSL
jgi:hypothetical protein